MQESAQKSFQHYKGMPQYKNDDHMFIARSLNEPIGSSLESTTSQECIVNSTEKFFFYFLISAGCHTYSSLDEQGHTCFWIQTHKSSRKYKTSVRFFSRT